MSDAKSLLLDAPAAILDDKKVAALFTEDGVVELPYLQSVGIAPRYQGCAAIEGFYDVVKQLYPDFAFGDHHENVRLRPRDRARQQLSAIGNPWISRHAQASLRPCASSRQRRAVETGQLHAIPNAESSRAVRFSAGK
ncbi:MAG TPA: hypothetical protein VKQ09_11680 [Sphingomonas sp.]|nr:hypothetical protein [Sphingomonas sp.]